MRLACSTSSFPQESLSRAIARVAWAGYRALELDLPGGDPERAERESDLAERLQANELELAAVNAGELGATDQDSALTAAGRIGRAALFAVALGGDRVVVAPPKVGDPKVLGSGLQRLLTVLAEVAVRIVVSNRAESLLATPSDLAELRQRVPSERLEFALDPGEAILAGWSPSEGLDAFPEPPLYLYLDDARSGALAPPGEGEVDWPRLGAVLRERGYDGPAVLRLAGADPWAVEPLAKEIRVAAIEWLNLDPWTA